MEASGLRRSNDVGSCFSPMGKAIWLLLSHSPSFAWRARFNLHYGESVAHFPCSSTTVRSVAVSVQIGIIPSLPRPFDLCQRPKSIADRAPIHSLSLACLPVRNSDGPEGVCTTNESHPEHARAPSPSLGPDPPARATFVLSLAVPQCISDRFRLYSDI